MRSNSFMDKSFIERSDFISTSRDIKNKEEFHNFKRE